MTADRILRWLFDAALVAIMALTWIGVVADCAMFLVIRLQKRWKERGEHEV